MSVEELPSIDGEGAIKTQTHQVPFIDNHQPKQAAETTIISKSPPDTSGAAAAAISSWGRAAASILEGFYQHELSNHTPNQLLEEFSSRCPQMSIFTLIQDPNFPQPSLEVYTSNLIKLLCVEVENPEETVIGALCLVRQLTTDSATGCACCYIAAPLCKWTVYRTFLSCVLLAAKYFNDKAGAKINLFAYVGGVDGHDLRHLEWTLLSLIGFHVDVPPNEFRRASRLFTYFTTRMAAR